MQVQAVTPTPSFQPFATRGASVPTGGLAEAYGPPFPAGTVTSLASGRELFAQGESADYWYKVESGVLRTCRLLPDGRRQIDAFALPGDFVGFEAGRIHTVAAEAVTPATVVRYARSRIEALADADAPFGRRLLSIALKQLGMAQERQLLLGRMTAEERLAAFLLEMSERAGGGDTIDLPMSRSDIGDYLALTIETVSRTLSAFKAQGVVSLPNRQRVVIEDRNSLESFDCRDRPIASLVA